MKRRGGWSGEQRAQGIQEGKTLSPSQLLSPACTFNHLGAFKTDRCLSHSRPVELESLVIEPKQYFFLKNSFPCCFFFFNEWSRLRTTGSRVALQGFQKRVHIRKEVGDWRPARMGEFIVFHTLEAGTTFMQIPSSLHSLYSPTAE